jgi:hypothetical protein
MEEADTDKAGILQDQPIVCRTHEIEHVKRNHGEMSQSYENVLFWKEHVFCLSLI